MTRCCRLASFSPQEVAKKWSEWRPAVDAEINFLLQEKEAMEEVSGERLKELLSQAEENGTTVEFLPSKLESTYSSGADAAALRLLLVTSSRMPWTAGTIDIKTAFLNAAMDQQDQKTLLLIKPPPLFLEKGLMKFGTYYLSTRAVYGLQGRQIMETRSRPCGKSSRIPTRRQKIPLKDP